MACKIENIKFKGQQLESLLGNQLLEIYGNLDQAKETYDKLTSKEFIDAFGDWVNEDFDSRTNENGEPFLVTETKQDGFKRSYFILKNGDPFDIEVREFNSFTSPDLTNDIKEITEQLASHIYRKSFNSDFETIEGSEINISKEIETFVNEKKRPIEEYLAQNEDEEVREVLEDMNNILKHKDEFKNELIKFFNARKIQINEFEQEALTQEQLDDGITGSDIIQSFERNSKDNATANVKLMLSFLPKINNLTGEREIGDFLGEGLFRSFDSVHLELQQQLSDITNLYIDGSVTDVFDLMYAKIKDLSNSKKSYVPLLEILDRIDEQKRTEFIQAFYLAKVNFYTSTIDTSGDTRFTVQNISTVNNPTDKKLKEYNVNFNNSFVNNGKLNLTKLNRIEQRFNTLFKEVQTKRKGGLSSDTDFYNEFGKEVSEFILLLEELGVSNFSGEEMDLFLKKFNVDNNPNAYRTMVGQFRSKISNMSSLMKEITSGKINASKTNIFKHYSNYVFNGISESQNYFTEELGDSTIFSNDKTYWTYARPSYIKNRTNTFKNNPKVLEQLLGSTYGRSSQWARHLLGTEKGLSGDYLHGAKVRSNISEKRLDLLEIGNFNSFQEKNKGKEGNDNKNISLVDHVSDKLNKVMQGVLNYGTPIYSTITPGDKSTLHEIKIDYFKENTLSTVSGKNLQFSEETLKIFTDYFINELDRMKIAYQELDTLPKSKLIVNYHTKNGQIYDKEGKLAGNAFKSSHIFSELSFENISPELSAILDIYNKDGSPKNIKGKIPSEKREIISKEINKILTERILQNNAYLQDKGIVYKTNDDLFKTYGIDSNIINEYSLKDGELTDAALKHFVSDFTINSLIASIEYSKLYTGDPAIYKGMVDFFKRVPATYSDGANLRLGLTEKDHLFDIAVLENVKVTSKFLDRIKDSLKSANMTADEKEYVLGAYSDNNINQTDAQAWITPKRWAFLIARTGKWNDKYQAVYDKIKASEPLTPEEFKTVAQPLKGVYFGLVNNVPTYLKYSQAVLLPQLVKGTQLQTLHDTMVSNDISESIVLDGIKVGATTPNKITDENGDILSDLKLDTLTLYNADWKLQQDLPTKTLKPTLVGSQIQKNIFSSLDDSMAYDTPFGTSNGTEMFQMINDNVSAMSNMAMAGLSSEIGKSNTGEINRNKLYSMLERELLDRGTSTNLLRSVQKNLPIEAIPGLKDKLYSIVFSKINKSAVKIKTNGGSFIQLSNFGLDKTTADEEGITWLVDPSELRPPLMETDAEGKKHIKAGQIFISHSQIATYIPGYAKMTVEKLQKAIDPKLLRAIGYRIPNQGQSSNDPLQIVGILPEAMGDTVVAYTEIPTKTGSDFDIDKMYIMLLNPDVQVNEATFKKAKQYIKQEDIDVNYMLDELSYSGFDLGSLDENNITSAIQDAFIKEHLLNSNSTLAHYDAFVKDFGIGKVDRLKYLEPDAQINKNNGKQLENRLFELYWSVLTNAGTYGDLITPIDFPHIKNRIKEIHGDNSKQTGENLKFHDPFYQLDLKFTYQGGKAGVGITANMLVDHNRSRFVDMQFNKYYLGIGHRENNNTLFDREYSEEMNGTKYKIKDTISAFLNAFVDNAKDPYINDGNFNSYTSSVAFMLIRAGVHPDWIISFIGHPVLKELADYTQIYESKVIPKENTSKSSFDIIYEKYSSNPYVGKPANKSNIKSLPDSGSNLQVLELFKEYQEKAKVLNASVQLSRFDTNGTGGSITDLMILKNNMYRMAFDGELLNHFDKYQKNGKKTSLGTQVENTLIYMEDILDNNPSLFLLGSAPMRDMVNHISVNLLASRGGNRGLLDNDEIGRTVFNELYKYIMSDFAPFKVENPLVYIKDTIKDLLKYKNTLEKEGINNFFLDNITIYDNSFGVNNKNKSLEFQDRLYRSAMDIMNDSPQLADKIFISSFLMNGFQTKLIDIKEYIPYQWFLEKGIREFINSKHMELKGSNVGLSYFQEQFIRNNSDNNILAPNIAEKNVDKVGGIPKGTMFQVDLEKNKRYTLGLAANQNKLAPRYIKMQEGLYSLLGYRGVNAIYTSEEKLGYSDPESFLDLKRYYYNSRPPVSSDKLGVTKAITNWINSNKSNYIPWENRSLDDKIYKKINEISLENILFSQENDVSSLDITQEEC